MTLASQSDRAWYLLIASLGMSVLVALITWDRDGVLTVGDYVMRNWNPLTVLAQVLFAGYVLVVLRRKGSTSRLTVVQTWLLVAVFTYVLGQVVFRGRLEFYLFGTAWLAHIVFLAAMVAWRPGRDAEMN